LQLSAQAYHRILKLSHTIADLAGSDEIQSVPLAEEMHLWPPEIDAWLTIDHEHFITLTV
jgi:magnesium chelatase family protein